MTDSLNRKAMKMILRLGDLMPRISAGWRDVGCWNPLVVPWNVRWRRLERGANLGWTPENILESGNSAINGGMLSGGLNHAGYMMVPYSLKWARMNYGVPQL